jgi:hypothetical protein
MENFINSVDYLKLSLIEVPEGFENSRIWFALQSQFPLDPFDPVLFQTNNN